MNIFSKKKYTLSNFPQYADFLKEHIKKHFHFSIDLIRSYSIFGVFKRQRKNIYHNILDKFIPISSRIYVYDLNFNSETVKPFHALLTNEYSRYKIELKKSSWLKIDSILYKPGIVGLISPIRGGIIGQCYIDDKILKDIFQYCYNPSVVDNPSAGCGKNAINQAKRSSGSGTFNFIIENANHGLESITFYSNMIDIIHIFDLASQFCKISDNYLNCTIKPEISYFKKKDKS